VYINMLCALRERTEAKYTVVQTIDYVTVRSCRCIMVYCESNPKLCMLLYWYQITKCFVLLCWVLVTPITLLHRLMNKSNYKAVPNTVLTSLSTNRKTRYHLSALVLLQVQVSTYAYSIHNIYNFISVQMLIINQLLLFLFRSINK
jgi:hypothetical protein